MAMPAGPDEILATGEVFSRCLPGVAFKKFVEGRHGAEAASMSGFGQILLAGCIFQKVEDASLVEIIVKAFPNVLVQYI